MPRYRSASIFASSSSKMHLNLIIQKKWVFEVRENKETFWCSSNNASIKGSIPKQQSWRISFSSNISQEHSLLMSCLINIRFGASS